MNSRQAQQYARGLAIAKRDALSVVAHGTRKSDGAAVYAVPSRTQANTWHLIVVDGLELTCDCAAAQHGRYCAHRAAVRARLEIEAEVRRAQ
jgi:SWIM zinc finger